MNFLLGSELAAFVPFCPHGNRCRWISGLSALRLFSHEGSRPNYWNILDVSDAPGGSAQAARSGRANTTAAVSQGRTSAPSSDFALRHCFYDVERPACAAHVQYAFLDQTSISKTAKSLHDIDLRHSLSVDQWNRSEFHGCDDAIRSHIGLNHIALTKSRLIGGLPIGKLPRDITCGWGDGT
jgi:hypothetical protein